MTRGMSSEGREEPVTFTDKRRIDPETGEIREGSGGQERSDTGAAPSGAAPGAPGAADAHEPAAPAQHLHAAGQRLAADAVDHPIDTTLAGQPLHLGHEVLLDAVPALTSLRRWPPPWHGCRRCTLCRVRAVRGPCADALSECAAARVRADSPHRAGCYAAGRLARRRS